MNAMIGLNSITKIESELQVRLPTVYRDTLLSYPFEYDSEMYNWTLFGDVDSIITENKSYRESGFFGHKWPSEYLVIGGDGLGNLYILDISKGDSAVFFVDHESTGYSDSIEMEEQSPSLATWITHIQEEDIRFTAEEELRECELAERKQNKKWWQFWI